MIFFSCIFNTISEKIPSSVTNKQNIWSVESSLITRCYETSVMTLKWCLFCFIFYWHESRFQHSEVIWIYQKAELWIWYASIVQIIYGVSVVVRFENSKQQATNCKQKAAIIINSNKIKVLSKSLLCFLRSLKVKGGLYDTKINHRQREFRKALG